MFSLMDRTVDGIGPMLSDLEAHIVDQGTADMIAAAETITSVGLFHPTQYYHRFLFCIFFFFSPMFPVKRYVCLDLLYPLFSPCSQ